MKTQLFTLSALALTLCLLSAQTFAAEEAKEKLHDGKLVSITSSKLMMTAKDKAATAMTHTLTADTKMMLDGKPCKFEDLKAGTKIRVTTLKSDAKIATHIEAIAKDKMFANTHDGKVVSITDSKLVMTDKAGKEHAHTVSADTQVCCDAAECKLSDLKSGMKIRVTTHKSDKNVAVAIEALDNNAEFALAN